MAEAEATIPERQQAALAAPNSETITEPETTVEEPQAPEPQAPEPKRGRGRPAGAKDKAPRTTKPKVRVEPIPQPKAKPAPAPVPAPIHQSGVPNTPTQSGVVSDTTPPVVEQRPPSPEPPSPRTLFRQTSAHLLNLRDVMNSQKRASAAERYTARLHAWPVV
jgi:hypothetical protein